MEDAKLGAGVRAVRLRRGWTQADVAARAGVHRNVISAIEAGRLDRVSFGVFRLVCRVLGVWTDLVARWRGIELSRSANPGHDALQSSLLRYVGGVPGWSARPEVSFSIFGERGVIDIVAWHAASRTMLIIELKTLFIDPAELVRTMDRRRRLGPTIARDHGWAPHVMATWVVLTDTRTNRRHARAAADLLAPLWRADGRRMRAWMRRPSGTIAALSFWPEPAAVLSRRAAHRRRPAP